MMTPAELQMLKAGALNILAVQPLSVDANNKLLLVQEVERLQPVLAALAAMLVDHGCGGISRHPCPTCQDARAAIAKAMESPR